MNKTEGRPRVSHTMKQKLKKAVYPSGLLWYNHCKKNRHFKRYLFFQLEAVSRVYQGRQREPSVKTLRSSLSVEFWRHCVLSDGTQHRA